MTAEGQLVDLGDANTDPNAQVSAGPNYQGDGDAANNVRDEDMKRALEEGTVPVNRFSFSKA